MLIVILLLFVIGIELRPARLWLMRRMVFGLGTLILRFRDEHYAGIEREKPESERN